MVQSNLRYGLDNWIYGTVGYSRFNGEVNGEGTTKFRHLPLQVGSVEDEFLSIQQQHLGHRTERAGDVFGSTANNNPSFFEGTEPCTTDKENDGQDDRQFTEVLSHHSETSWWIHSTPTPQIWNAHATSSSFESWRNRRAFVCGPTGHLLGMYDVRPKGSGFESVNAFSLVASADEWFSPIVAEVGPDGNLWFADWYNFIIQHNPTPNPNRGGYAAKTGPGNAHVNPNRDRQHGRIYVWSTRVTCSVSPAPMPWKQMVDALSHDNMFWRLTAQRLLVDGGYKQAVTELTQLLSQPPPVSLHALWALHGLGSLDRESHARCLISPDPALRRNAIRAIPNDLDGQKRLYDSATLADKDLLVRLDAFVKLASFELDDGIRKTASLLMQNQQMQERMAEVAPSGDGCE